MTTLETERRIFAEIQEHKMAYNVRQKIKPAYDILKHEAVGAMPFTSDIYRFLLEGIASALNVNLDAEYEQPEPEAPAPAPVLIPTGAPSGQMNFSQPGYLQEPGTRVANTSEFTSNVMAGRQPVPTDQETVYAPGLGAAFAGVAGQTIAGVSQPLDAATLVALVERLESIMAHVGEPKPEEKAALEQHANAKPNPYEEPTKETASTPLVSSKPVASVDNKTDAANKDKK